MPQRTFEPTVSSYPVERPEGPSKPIGTEEELREAIEQLAQNSGKKSMEVTRKKMMHDIRAALTRPRTDN